MTEIRRRSGSWFDPAVVNALVAGAHHERLDGRGYPRGLDASRISLETRLISTADIFDAITAERPYRAAVPVPRALDMMEKLRGSALADECLDALHECPPLLRGFVGGP